MCCAFTIIIFFVLVFRSGLAFGLWSPGESALRPLGGWFAPSAIGIAFVAFGLLKKEPEFALAVYVGFLALLRGCEIFNLDLADCQPRGVDQMCLVLRDTEESRF